MDPITGFANVATALINLATVAIEGQSAAQKIIIWDFVIQSMTDLRTLFHLPPVVVPPTPPGA